VNKVDHNSKLRARCGLGLGQRRSLHSSTYHTDERDKIVFFTKQYQTCKTKTKTKTTAYKTKTDFSVSDRSRPKTDRLRPHHWDQPRYTAYCTNASRGLSAIVQFPVSINPS